MRRKSGIYGVDSWKAIAADPQQFALSQAGEARLEKIRMHPPEKKADDQNSEYMTGSAVQETVDCFPGNRATGFRDREQKKGAVSLCSFRRSGREAVP